MSVIFYNLKQMWQWDYPFEKYRTFYQFIYDKSVRTRPETPISHSQDYLDSEWVIRKPGFKRVERNLEDSLRNKRSNSILSIWFPWWLTGPFAYYLYLELFWKPNQDGSNPDLSKWLTQIIMCVPDFFLKVSFHFSTLPFRSIQNATFLKQTKV